jgi:hypothetical protein
MLVVNWLVQLNLKLYFHRGNQFISVKHFYLILVIVCFSSCDYFSFERKKNVQELDTIVDRSSVDVFPSFAVCDSLIDKEKKTHCFRETIHREISAQLSQEEIKVKKPVDEVVNVVITVHADHKLSLKSFEASDSLLSMIPDLKQRVENSIQKLPKVHAAIKRGIPVTSEYKLPIQIKIED